MERDALIHSEVHQLSKELARGAILHMELTCPQDDNYTQPSILSESRGNFFKRNSYWKWSYPLQSWWRII